MLELCDVALNVLHVCINAYRVCCRFFSDDRIERRLCGGRGSVWVSGGRWSGTSQPRQAIYLLHIWILLSHNALFYSCFYSMHCFSYIAINPWIAIVCDLAPQVVLLSSMKDDTFNTYSLPLKVETRWLASKSLGETCSGAKNSRMGKLSVKFWKWFRKTLE
jgi:hypothetical protein